MICQSNGALSITVLRNDRRFSDEEKIAQSNNGEYSEDIRLFTNGVTTS
jgi:hypothetical protein